jgi:hypothetical protein
MMKGRRKKSKKGPELHLPPLAPEVAERLRAQVVEVQQALAAGEDIEELKVLVNPDPDDLPWDLHLLAALATVRHEAIPRLLADLFGKSPDKERLKALKRALHVLKTRGIQVPEDILPRPEAGTGFWSPSPAALAFVSPIFGNGERYVVLEGPKEFLGGNFLAARLSDTAGFRECHLLSLKRGRREEFWGQFHAQGLDFADVPPAYAVRLLEEAFDQDLSNEAAADYAPLRTALWQHWGFPEKPEDLTARLPALAEAERQTCLERARDLVRTDLFLSWLPSMEEIAPWVKKVQEVQDSPLILSEHQQRARYDHIMEEAARSLYPPDDRDRWRRRLLEMAYFLDLKGRSEEARAAQAAAEDLATAEPSAFKGENPFFVGLIMLAVRLALEHRKHTEAQVPPGLVTPSGESLLIRR